jgi:hypothetical protein
MRILDKIALILYSYIMLIFSVLICIIFSGLVEFDVISNYIKGMLSGDTSGKIILGVSIVFILLSIRTIFFESNTEKKKKPERKGILLENENGKLIISKETIENLVNTLAKEDSTILEVNSKVDVDNESKLIINIEMVVSQSAVIAELSSKLQQKVKETVKHTSNLDVKTINIKIKDYINA